MQIPIFPLNGAVLFPKTNLPLNIFDIRYVDMVNYSLSKKRLIGMLQQKESGELFNVGCYGKITVFNETNDKRFLINLEGVSCFKIKKEIKTSNQFRICEIEELTNYQNNEINEELKPKILDIYKNYLKFKKLNLVYDDLNDLRLVDLLKFIVMVSPLQTTVKQMLLELQTNQQLYDTLLSIIEIELASNQENNSIN